MEAHYQENSHSVEGGEEHHEKKTVMNKVKDRARKMKNTFNKMAHGHNADDDHKHEHDSDAASEEEEVDEVVEEEREADTEVHGAPMYESEAAGHFAGERGENLGPVKEVNFGEAVATAAVDQSNSGPKVNRLGTTAASDESQLLYPSTATGTAAGEQRNLISDQDENIDPLKIASRAMAGTVEEEDPFPPRAKTGTPAAATQPGHPSYPSPTGNTTGGDEVGESPLLSSFQADKPKGAEDVIESPVLDKPQGAEGVLESPVSDKPQGAEGTLESPPTVTRDQLSPDKPQQDAPREGTEEQKSSSYTEKISSAATTAKDAAVSAVIGSVEYGKKIASTLYGMVSEAGTTIMGKIASTVYDMVSVARTTIMGKGMTQGEKNDGIKTGQPEKENGVSVAE